MAACSPPDPKLSSSSSFGVTITCSSFAALRARGGSLSVGLWRLTNRWRKRCCASRARNSDRRFGVTPLGLVHAWSYRYDDGVRWMTDLAWVVAYEGGEVVPGDDMAGCEVGWFLPERMTSLGLTVPEGAEWLLRRVLAVYRLSRT